MKTVRTPACHGLFGPLCPQGTRVPTWQGHLFPTQGSALEGMIEGGSCASGARTGRSVFLFFFLLALPGAGLPWGGNRSWLHLPERVVSQVCRSCVSGMSPHPSLQFVRAEAI